MNTKSTEPDETIRNRRLRDLVKSFKSQRAFADKVGLDPSYVTRLLMPPSSPHRKRMGSTIARRIEVRTGHPKYWLNGEDIVEREWPFAGINPKRFSRLRPKERRLIEGVVECMIATFESAARQQSANKSGPTDQTGISRQKRAA
jgi:hypothetical protein